jgi:hypothetical protein
MFAGARRLETVSICFAVEPRSPSEQRPAQPPQLAPVAGRRISDAGRSQPHDEGPPFGGPCRLIY